MKGFQIKTLPGLFCWLLAILLLAGPVGAQQPPAQVGGELPEKAVRQIKAMLTTKAQRTAAQRKVSSQLLDAAVSSQLLDTAASSQLPDTAVSAQLLDTAVSAQQPRGPAAAAGQQAADLDGSPGPEPEPERVTVDIRCFIRELLLTFSLSSTTCNSAWVSRGFSVIKHV